MGHSTFVRTGKHLSFLTFLEDADQIMFKQYKGIPPIIWKDDDVYFLEACTQLQVRTCKGFYW